jgi:hypothetical protein
MRADVVKPKLQADVPKRGEVIRFRTALDKIGSLDENGRQGLAARTFLSSKPVVTERFVR